MRYLYTNRGRIYLRIFGIVVVVISLFILNCSEDGSRDGWEAGSSYNQHYDVQKFEKIRGWVVDVKKVVPMPGMSPAVALDIKENGEIVEVQLCPAWFTAPDEIGIKKGDRVKIKGIKTIINGKEVFMASKIKKGDFFEFKVRLTKNGKPFWTMTLEELSKEREPLRDD